jgi:hypothetical protein
MFIKRQDKTGWQILLQKNVDNNAIISLPTSDTNVHSDVQVAPEKIDRYTELYRAISPANFVEPYYPDKVKLANELLEALIQNKDNEVVISLIEEKAKAKLGIKLSDN